MSDDLRRAYLLGGSHSLYGVDHDFVWHLVFVFRWVRVRLRRSTVQYYVHVLLFLARHLETQFTDSEELYQL